MPVSLDDLAAQRLKRQCLAFDSDDASNGGDPESGIEEMSCADTLARMLRQEVEARSSLFDVLGGTLHSTICVNPSMCRICALERGRNATPVCGDGCSGGSGGALSLDGGAGGGDDGDGMVTGNLADPERGHRREACSPGATRLPPTSRASELWFEGMNGMNF